MVVGTDGSGPAENAVRWAAREASACGLELLILLVHTGVDPALMADPLLWRHYRDDLLDGARQGVAHAVAVARSEVPDLAVSSELVEGPPAATLLDRAGDGPLVVGAHRASGGPFTGSVAATVTAHARGPVVVVPDGPSPAPDAPVVVGVDGSPASGAAIAFAVDTAAAVRCPLVAVHTWWDLLPTPELEHLLDGEAIPRGEYGVLAAHLAGPSATHPDVAITPVGERAHPARALLEHARGARMVVVGTRGRGGFAGLLLGSVSRTLVHRATCPVAVVPPARPRRSTAPGRVGALARHPT
jgi:nucleotide-binding universal stress UspA family protein